MTEIFRITNKIFDSNTYFISVSITSAIIIDPGQIDITPYINWLKDYNKTINAVILTHEHFDHCAGVNALIQLGDFKLICSENTAKSIQNSRQNLSAYFEGITPFEIDYPTQIIKDYEILKIDDIEMQFFETPGHSPGSICIKTGNIIFTGDTLLNNIKTPLNLPKSSKNDYIASSQKLKKILFPGIQVYPGHGDPFKYNLEKN